MNVQSHGFMENRSFQLKPDSFFDKIVNLVDEGNMQNFFLFCLRSTDVFIDVKDISADKVSRRYKN